MIAKPDSAIVVGVGPERGLGAALASCFAAKGLHVFIVGRSSEKLNAVAQAIQAKGGEATGIVADVTVAQDAARCFDIVRERGDNVQVAAYNVDNNIPAPFLQTDEKTFTALWRQNCLGAFLFAKEIVAIMQTQQQGTVFFYWRDRVVKSQTAIYRICFRQSRVASIGTRFGKGIFAARHTCSTYGDRWRHRWRPRSQSVSGVCGGKGAGRVVTIGSYRPNLLGHSSTT
jgi:NAD(P)-dependent dehydrogenase (short-subunit alcohol dehydrogenase family)